MPLSVLEEIVERGPHGRHSQKFGYRVRAREDQLIRVKKAQRGWLGQQLATPAKAVVIAPSIFEIRAMDEEILAAQFILGIENDFESADFVPYTEKILTRATAFLRRLMIAAHSAGVFGIGVPQIGPADHGSIDLFWEKTDRTLLMNFPPLKTLRISMERRQLVRSLAGLIPRNPHWNSPIGWSAKNERLDIRTNSR